MLAAARFHDPALRVGEVILVAGTRFRGRCFERWADHSLTPFFFGGPLGQFLFVFGQGNRVARLGAGFDLGPRFLQRGFALLAASDLFGKAQSVLQGRAVGLLGLPAQARVLTATTPTPRLSKSYPRMSGRKVCGRFRRPTRPNSLP